MVGSIAPEGKGLFLHTVLEPLKTVFRVKQGDKIVGDYVTLQEAMDVYGELETEVDRNRTVIWTGRGGNARKFLDNDSG